MDLTPWDIEEKKFRKCFRGLDEHEVKAFLSQISAQLAELISENKKLKTELREKETIIKEYKERENLLRNTLVSAQQSAEQIRANAEKEAQIIIAEAELEAERILNKTQHRLAQIHEDIIELKRQRTQLEVRLRSTIESHLKMLDLEKKESIESDDLEEKIKFLRQP
ncbi:MAG: DivIVA domain-containing protein [Deltaproteobacteria bacterium]|nr:MAG: DivIVA domain-containing protein [Deltaproteobacteria bacterium]